MNFEVFGHCLIVGLLLVVLVLVLVQFVRGPGPVRDTKP